jgi:hypothetical protein
VTYAFNEGTRNTWLWNQVEMRAQAQLEPDALTPSGSARNRQKGAFQSLRKYYAPQQKACTARGGGMTLSMGRPTILAPRAATASALVLVLLALAACTNSHHGVPASSTSSPGLAASSAASSVQSLAPDPVPAPQRSAIASALTASDPTSVSAVLAAPVASGFLASPIALLPAGSHIAIDWSKIQVDGDFASVPALVTGPRPASWTLLLIEQDGRWLMYGTQQGVS